VLTAFTSETGGFPNMSYQSCVRLDSMVVLMSASAPETTLISARRNQIGTTEET